MSDTLQTAQKCFTAWLEHIDSKLAESVLCFEEFTKYGKAGDLKRAGAALGTAEKLVWEVRREIAEGLERGYDENDPKFHVRKP